MPYMDNFNLGGVLLKIRDSEAREIIKKILSSINGSAGNKNKPIFLENGEFKECENKLNVDITGTATNATHAVNADSADEATHALTADSATNANHAVSADSATNANHAVSADSADEATHAVSADSATNATNATNANHAKTADEATHATSANSANEATHATSANSATNATHAVSADNATNATKLNNTTIDSLLTWRVGYFTGHLDAISNKIIQITIDAVPGYQVIGIIRLNTGSGIVVPWAWDVNENTNVVSIGLVNFYSQGADYNGNVTCLYRKI